MSDRLDQRIREAFMEFRDDIRVEIYPPEPQDVRRTVTRRQRIRGGTVIAGLAVVLAAGLAPYIAPAAPGRFGTASDPAPPHAQALVDEAFQAMGLDPTQTRLLPGAWWGTGLSYAVPHTFATVFGGELPAGDYPVQVACAGEGSLTFSWTVLAMAAPFAWDQIADASPIATGDLATPCGAHGSSRTGIISLPAPGVIRLEVQGDAAAALQSGFAAVVTDPRATIVEELLDFHDADLVISTAGEFTLADSTTLSLARSAGRYRLSAACVGTGTLRLALTTVAEEVSRDLACDPLGALLQIEIRNLVDRQEITATVSVLGTGGVAYAFRIDQP